MELGRVAVWIALFATSAMAQPHSPSAPPPETLENTGAPMRLPFHCTDEDMQWAGLACSEQDPCPIYLELSAVAAIGSRLFTAGEIHSETVTLDSVLLSSEDGGKNWQEPYPRIRGAGLDHLQFTDFSNGWASGETLFPLPQDPFLLATKDGGKSWQRHPVFSETHPGSIQQFRFSSKDNGSLVIDRGEGSEQERYELYETPDGGNVWEFKQASNRPLPLPATPTPPPLWRVRADGRTQAFVLEHQQGSRWTSAAAFSIKVGTCAPAGAAAR